MRVIRHLELAVATTPPKPGNHMSEAAGVETMTQAEFARRRGVSRKTVTTWKQQGFLVVFDDGQIDVAASEAVLDARPPSYRGGVTSGKPQGNGVTGNAAPEDETPDPNGLMTLPQSQRTKEMYLALQRKQEYEANQGLLVSVEDVAKQVEAEYGLVRERLLVIPGKVADALVGKSREDIEAIIMAEVNEALDELHAPSAEGRG